MRRIGAPVRVSLARDACALGPRANAARSASSATTSFKGASLGRASQKEKETADGNGSNGNNKVAARESLTSKSLASARSEAGPLGRFN